MPDEEIYKSPEFSLYYSWVLVHSGQGPKAAPYLDKAEILISEITPIGREIKKLLDDKSHLKQVLKKGSEKAIIIAEENLKNIRDLVGLCNINFK